MGSQKCHHYDKLRRITMTWCVITCLEIRNCGLYVAHGLVHQKMEGRGTGYTGSRLLRPIRNELIFLRI